MKKHAIIPIFIPHEGCENECVFCNQKKITARSHAEENVDIDAIASRYLSTLQNPRPEVIEMAMYGGSFTGIPIERQNEYLSIAKRYKDKGLIDKIHLSTRPDYIDEEILTNLKRFGVDVIELGVQSFDDDVLNLSERGHDSSIVYKSSRLIQDFGFVLGIQLMIGLPGDNDEKAIFSAQQTVKIGPEIARLYPTIVIEDTKLLDMYKCGEYQPLNLETAIERTKKMYTILSDAGINIIRVGLKSSDIINQNGEIYGSTFHPAFRQLVESRIAREQIESQLNQIAAQLKSSKQESSCSPLPGISKASGSCNVYADKFHISLSANSKSFSNMIGMKKENIEHFKCKFPDYKYIYIKDEALSDYEYKAEYRKDVSLNPDLKTEKTQKTAKQHQ